MGNLFKHIRRRFGAGLFIVLPLFITVWVLYIMFSVIDSWITPSLMKLLATLQVPFIDTIQARIIIPVIGIIVLFFFIYILGLLGSNYIGKSIGRLLEERILKIPFIRSIYGGSKQILEAFSSSGEKAFRSVVIVEYPRQGLFSLGFLTTEQRDFPDDCGGSGMIGIFVPTTPNPTSGMFVLVPKKEVIMLDISIEEGVKMIVSGGLITPEQFGKKMRRM